MSSGTVLTPELKKRADQICAQYELRRAAILPVMNLIQHVYGAISGEAEVEIAQYFEIPPADVRELMTFYTLFHSTPKGKQHIGICRTLSCALRGAEELLRYCEARLNIRAGQTTPDGQFSLDAVECLGACEIAPMAKLNEDYVGPLAKEVIDGILAGRAPDPTLIQN